MANKLIDADALIRKQKYYTKAIMVYRQYAVEVLEAAPAVDAVEVVHGHWTAVKYIRHCNCDKASNSIEEYMHKCSVCNRVAHWQPYGLNYCPNCGAKMDGDGNDI